MKAITLALLLSAGFSFSQTSFISNDHVVSNLTRDTAYIKDDPTGRNIYYTWQLDPYYDGKKVIAILVDDLTEYHQRYEMLAEASYSENKKRKKPRNKK